ncbi:MAG: carbon storage regulator CsrA [Granulosicoccaceae bacterium]
MLILTRRMGESIIIGDDVMLTVVGISGSQVKFGIDAPKNITVHRQEIYNKNKGSPDKVENIQPTAE